MLSWARAASGQDESEGEGEHGTTHGGLLGIGWTGPAMERCSDAGAMDDSMTQMPRRAGSVYVTFGRGDLTAAPASLTIFPFPPRFRCPCTSSSLIRHGQSQWNLDNRFSGWADVDLTEQGIAEAKEAGALLKQAGYQFDVAHTSVLKRCVRTLWGVQEAMDQMWIPVLTDWRLNERHYGALTGLNKAETAAKYGEEQVKIWRRSYDTPPPALGAQRQSRQCTTRATRRCDPAQIPDTECLKDTVARVLPYWHEVLAPAIRSGQRVLVVAHGNSMRALVKYLDEHLRRRDRRREHPQRHSAGLRVRRETCVRSGTSTWAMPRRSPPRWPPWPTRARPSKALLASGRG